MFGRFRKLFAKPSLSESDIEQERQKIVQSAPVPRLWMLGKTGSGKTSIVKYLTGADDAEIGNGFKPQTQFSREYEFPSADSPVMRFVDTRGLGEALYDATEDLARFDAGTQLVIVVARAMDHALGDLVAVVERIRRAQPDRPVILALTCLHEAYPGEQHPDPDPFEPPGGDLPAALRKSLELQKARFESLADDVVPIDLTPPEEGFEASDFGGERLKAAIIRRLPAAYRQSFAGFEAARKAIRSMNEKRALPEIVSHSVLAATAAAVPVPWVDIPGVIGIQSNLVRRIASIYGQEMSSRLVLDMAGAAGSRMMLQMLVREPLKLIPFVGMAANAALAFAYTFGLGKASCWYFGELRNGNRPSMKEVESVWSEAIASARALWKSADASGSVAPPAS